MTTRIISGALKTMNLVVQGDSIPAGSGTTGDNPALAYAALYTSNSLNYRTVTLNNIAAGGSAVSDVTALSSTVTGLFDAGKNLNVLHIHVGINDIFGSNDMAVKRTALASYGDGKRTEGWYVVLGTILPCDNTLSNGNGNYNTQSATHNAIIKTWVGLHCDAIVDFRANATMGPNTAPNDTNLYVAVPNKVHPTNLGHTTLAPDFALIMNRVTQ